VPINSTHAQSFFGLFLYARSVESLQKMLLLLLPPLFCSFSCNSWSSSHLLHLTGHDCQTKFPSTSFLLHLFVVLQDLFLILPLLFTHLILDVVSSHLGASLSEGQLLQATGQMALTKLPGVACNSLSHNAAHVATLAHAFSFLAPTTLNVAVVSVHEEVGAEVVGDAVGDFVGDLVGKLVGDLIGDLVGKFVGDLVGIAVGDAVGVNVGDPVSMLMLSLVGAAVGVLTLLFGAAVGAGTSVTVGELTEIITFPEFVVTSIVRSSL